MIRNLLFLLALGMSLTIKSQNNCYTLIWSDEFNSSSLDMDVWNIEVNDWGGGNNELQYYTARPENIRIENGNLVIEARKENYLTRNYTSGRITTQKKVSFTYGRIEARLKLPYGKGIWPAFWMLGESISSIGWPSCGEIDIMEMIGGGINDATTHSTLHWRSNTGHVYYGKSYTLSTGKLADNYHIYAVEWDDKKISGFIDNIKYFEMNITDKGLEAFHNNFFIILNVAVGGNWPGSPDATTVFPQRLLVDYVRVYKKSNNFKILGKTEVLENEDSLVYSVSDYSDSINYSWIIPSSAEVQATNKGTITLKWGCSDDSIKLKIKAKCDSTILVFPVKVKKPKITGKKWVSEGSSNLSYKIDSIPGSTIQWQSSSGIIIKGSANQSTVIIDANAEGKLIATVTSICNTYKDSIDIRFGDGQFPYPDSEKPAKIPGTIQPANFDYGGPLVAYYDKDVGNKGGAYRSDEDVDIQFYDNGYTIGWFESGEWLEYTIFVEKTGIYRGAFRVATLTGGAFSIYVNDKLIANKINVKSTGGWNIFSTVYNDTLKFTEGKHVLRIVSHGGFNLGRMTFTFKTDVPRKISKNLFQVYPNPSSEKINIKLSEKYIPTRCYIYNLEGKVVDYFVISSAFSQFDVSNLKKGLYYLSIPDDPSVRQLLIVK